MRPAAASEAPKQKPWRMSGEEEQRNGSQPESTPVMSSIQSLGSLTDGMNGRMGSAHRHGSPTDNSRPHFAANTFNACEDIYTFTGNVVKPLTSPSPRSPWQHGPSFVGFPTIALCTDVDIDFQMASVSREKPKFSGLLGFSLTKNCLLCS